mmetsp:Transcript_30508/g.78955  ORF Transcript_30508/g.78955 Transcript_30508/m.78955 type:complete len:301 (-) Transcript_30508:1326-2228(-)
MQEPISGNQCFCCCRIGRIGNINHNGPAVVSSHFPLPCFLASRGLTGRLVYACVRGKLCNFSWTRVCTPLRIVRSSLDRRHDVSNRAGVNALLRHLAGALTPLRNESPQALCCCGSLLFACAAWHSSAGRGKGWGTIVLLSRSRLGSLAGVGCAGDLTGLRSGRILAAAILRLSATGCHSNSALVGPTVSWGVVRLFFVQPLLCVPVPPVARDACVLDLLRSQFQGCLQVRRDASCPPRYVPNCFHRLRPRPPVRLRRRCLVLLASLPLHQLLQSVYCCVRRITICSPALRPTGPTLQRV